MKISELNSEKLGKLHAYRNAALMEYQDMMSQPKRNIFEAITDNAFYTQHQLLTIAGRPDAGKTQIGMHIAKSQLMNDIPVSYIALEEMAGDVYTKLANFAGDNVKGLLVEGVGMNEVQQIIQKIRRDYEFGFEFFVLDQLSLVDVDSVPTIREKYDKVQRMLLELVMELPITILQISQLNREAPESDTPENNLAESDRVLGNSKWLGVVIKSDEVDDQTNELILRVRKSKDINGRYRNYRFKFDYKSSLMFDIKEIEDREATKKKKPAFEGYM